MITVCELVGFDAFDGLRGWVPDHGIVIWGHGDGASGECSDLEPVAACAFNPVFNGLIDGLVSIRVETNGSPMSVGVVDGKCPEIIDDLFGCSIFEQFFNDWAEGKFEKLLIFSVPDEDLFLFMKAVSAFCGVPEGVCVADSEGCEADDAADDTCGCVGGESDDEVSNEVFGCF